MAVAAAAFTLPLAVLALSAWADSYRFPVTIVAAEGVLRVDVTGGTVAEALALAGIEHDADDVLIPPATASLAPGEVVTLHRVERRRLDQVVETPFETIRLPAPYLARGSEVVLADGRKGRSRVRLEVVHVDGKPYAENLLASEVLAEPRARRVVIGTGGQVASGRRLDLVATAYTPGTESCGPDADGRTATGGRAGYGVVAVDPNVIPLGTRLYVEGYGPAVAADVGSGIVGDRIDLCFEDIATARRFGRRTVRVYVLSPLR